MSKMQRIPIAAASDDQLREYCDVQQLELAENTRSAMVAALGVIGHDHILVAEDDAPTQGQTASAAPTPQMAIPTGVAGDKEPIWLVEIGETEMPGGKDPVPVSVNGKALILQRNMRIPLPHRYKLALDNAERGAVDQDERTHEITTSRVRNYPFQILERPTDAEIAAWHQRSGSVELGASALMPA